MPFLPWFGVVLLGMFGGTWLFDRQPQAALINWQARKPLPRVLALAGRHSLHIYMLHQPFFLAMLYPVHLFMGQG